MLGDYDNYTNIVLLGEEICIRARNTETREPLYYRIPFQPKTYRPCANITQATDNWRTLDNEPLQVTHHKSIRDYRAYIQRSTSERRRIYGDISPVQQFMAEHVSKTCGVPFSSLRTAIIDIEVASQGGFAPPENPYQPITAITACVWDHYYVWGNGAYTTDRENVTYHRCKTESELLTSFLVWWGSDYPDIVTGWNTHTYDLPYIINRIERLRDAGEMKLTSKVLSPWRKISTRLVTVKGQELKIPDIFGVPILDYLELYQKFSLGQRESYRLDAIAEEELGKKKISYDEYGSLQRLADENYQKFVDYNIMDVQLVCELNEKLHHLDLCTQIAYDARVNYLDTFKQVRLWDAMMYYDLFDQQIAIPSKVFHDKSVQFSGGYVKEPLLGKHEWVVSFDVNSLYPSIMRQWNISPDRHLPIEFLESRLHDVERIRGAMREVAPSPEECTPREWLDNVREQDAPIVRWALREAVQYLHTTDIEQALRDLRRPAPVFPWLKVLSICITPNKQAFRADAPGFLPVMLSRLYEERAKNKKIATAASKELELIEQELKSRGVKI